MEKDFQTLSEMIERHPDELPDDKRIDCEVEVCFSYAGFLIKMRIYGSESTIGARLRLLIRILLSLGAKPA